MCRKCWVQTTAEDERAQDTVEDGSYAGMIHVKVHLLACIEPFAPAAQHVDSDIVT